MRRINNNNSKTGFMAKNGIVAALYVVMTVVLSPFSYGALQFRVAEVFMLLPFYNRKYSTGLVLGCMISNMFSPMGVADVLVGTLSTIIVCYGYRFIRWDWLAAIFTSVVTGIVIGSMLVVVSNVPLQLAFFATALGEFVVLIMGVVLFRYLMKNEQARNFILA